MIHLADARLVDEMRRLEARARSTPPDRPAFNVVHEVDADGCRPRAASSVREDAACPVGVEFHVRTAMTNPASRDETAHM
jgi:hypothetical protein